MVSWGRGFGNHADEAVRVSVHVRPERQAVDHGEDAGVDADAHRQCQHHHRGEQRIAADQAEAVAHIFEEGFQQQRGTAGGLPRSPPPTLRGNSPRDVHQRVRKHCRGGLSRRRGGARRSAFAGLKVEHHDRGFGRFLVAEGALRPQRCGGAARSLHHEHGQEREERGKCGEARPNCRGSTVPPARAAGWPGRSAERRTAPASCREGRSR